MGPWASLPDDLAVAFYDRGALLRAYAIEELLQDPNSLPHSVSHFIWAREVIFDKKNDSFIVATAENVVQHFDITTGKLTNSKAIEFPSFTVEVDSLSGNQYTLSDFASTGRAYMSEFLPYFKFELQESPSQYVFGWETIEPDRGDGISRIQYYGVPFSEIVRIDRTEDSTSDVAYWRIWVKSGDEKVIQVSAPDRPRGKFTGYTQRGETVDLFEQDINHIVFR